MICQNAPLIVSRKSQVGINIGKVNQRIDFLFKIGSQKMHQQFLNLAIFEKII